MYNPPEKRIIYTGRKFYRPQLPLTYKETELSEELNYGMEWALRDYFRSLNQAKDPIPSRYDTADFLKGLMQRNWIRI